MLPGGLKSILATTKEKGLPRSFHQMACEVHVHTAKSEPAGKFDVTLPAHDTREYLSRFHSRSYFK